MPGEFSNLNLDPDLRDLLPGYLERRRKDVERVRQAIETQDFRTIEMIGHRLSGNAGNFGLERLGQIGRDLESAGRARDLAGVRDSAARFEHYVAHLDLAAEC